MDWTLSKEKIENELSKLERSIHDPISLCQEAITYCGAILEDYRRKVVTEGFPDQTSEIRFFKEAKPLVLGQWIYYQEIRGCELRMPRWGQEIQIAFLKREQERLNSFFDQQLDMRLYMEMGDTAKDVVYFTRKHLDHPADGAGYSGYRDPNFNTCKDESLARLMGLKRYGTYIQKKILNIGGKGGPDVPTFQFTHPVTAAMELIYAFKEARIINHGNFEIKAFAEYFGKIFGIEIKDPYGLYKQIANRKTDRSKYLRKLLDAFENALEERDRHIP